MGKRKKLPYQEGTWFAVPLPQGKYVVGIVARLDGRGCVFGYFFGPKRDHVPKYEEIAVLQARNVLWRGQFGDLHLIQNRWPIIGDTPKWSRRAWPLPPFIRVDDEDVPNSYAVRVIYDDNLELVSEEPCKPSLAKKYPEDGLSGAEAVEDYLSYLLDG